MPNEIRNAQAALLGEGNVGESLSALPIICRGRTVDVGNLKLGVRGKRVQLAVVGNRQRAISSSGESS